MDITALRIQAKLQLRIRNEAFDDEVDELVAAAIEDLKRRGVDTGRLITGAAAGQENPLAVRAVMLYTKAHFGLSVSEHETARHERAYEQTAQAISLGDDYRTAAEA